MKKFLLMGLIAVFVAGFATVSYASIDNTFEVAIVTVDGKVQVDEQGSGKWIDAVPGVWLKEGAGIKTGRFSMAEVVYDAEGLNIVNVDDKTQVTVQKGSLDLEDGSVLVNFYNLAKGSKFIVKTPDAICSVRGSGMGVAYLGGMTIVRAFEGKVYVQGVDANGNPVGKEIVITEGWKISIESGQIPEAPVELSTNELIIWDGWVAVITGETTPEEGKEIPACKKCGQRHWPWQPCGGDEDEELDNKDLDANKTISPSSW